MKSRLKYGVVLAAVTLTFVSFTVAAPADEEYPPNAKPGECWAKCVVQPSYSTFTEQVTTREASTRIEVVPAVYEQVTERVMVKPATKRLEVVPAVYGKETEQIMVKGPSSRLEKVPAVYETVTEKIEVSPATTRWEKGKASASCLSANPEDCRVWCLVEVPAKFKTISKRVLKTSESTRTVEIPATYKTITKQIVRTPASTREIEIPAEYKTMTHTVMKTPPTTREIAVPAEFNTVARQRLDDAGGVGEWRRVICDAQLTSGKIRSIQLALKDAGFNPGPIDNIFGAQTKQALIRYQAKNNLPQGNLDFETLKSLGVER